ncbi:hypothetical protein JRYRANMO_CDS_0051 [Salmonella phage FM4b]|uniref:Uncharacterized protein n=4 Tax=Caudoviricetes TaxID=2731619 RepID=A0A7S9SPL3_9CAUD|nr:hypothetical protein GECvBB1_gp058c [Salmonella phage GEC_vB_B1]QPI14246.1 hypothetical protein GECvBBS_gp058c [Salmonella phage GEC_vB_BS]QPI15692.1 hypothetical protein GECvBNS7_gp058c [Salmonella phage GEC_vB_NS7]WVH07057.1 hypothetical protein IKARNLZQ_CDS_0049 [Salmonella phage FG1m]WVH07200.1 hypothetical protein JRYRANMO_CDS_0051 [Salmonella phage FM4b]
MQNRRYATKTIQNMYNKFPHIVLRLTLMYWCLNYTYSEVF